MTWFFPTIFSTFLLLALGGCSHQPDKIESRRELKGGTITYPFIKAPPHLGKDGQDERFIIRTVSGRTEYIVEIPQAADEYNVTVPLAIKDQLGESDPELQAQNPQLTDRELLTKMPRPDGQLEQDRALLDRAFGVGDQEGPGQAPSYALGLAKIKRLYRQQRYELALIEINNLLSYYPQSDRLYKMKGSVYIKTGNLELAAKSWQRAKELAPDDRLIRKGLQRLQRRLRKSENVVADSTEEAAADAAP